MSGTREQWEHATFCCGGNKTSMVPEGERLDHNPLDRAVPSRMVIVRDPSLGFFFPFSPYTVYRHNLEAETLLQEALLKITCYEGPPVLSLRKQTAEGRGWVSVFASIARAASACCRNVVSAPPWGRGCRAFPLVLLSYPTCPVVAVLSSLDCAWNPPFSTFLPCVCKFYRHSNEAGLLKRRYIWKKSLFEGIQ